MKQLISELLNPEVFRGNTKVKRSMYYLLLALAFVGAFSMFYGLFQLFSGTTSGSNIPWI
jgi:hypothetical protein